MQRAEKIGNWSGWHSFIAMVLLGATGVAGLVTPTPLLLAGWLAMVLSMALFVVIVGQGVTGFWVGAFIDRRNRISLSRLQMVLWTILVLSSFLGAALINIREGVTGPLAVAVPEEMWLLMGISTTSLVGSPLLLGTKSARQVSDEERDEAVSQPGVDKDKLRPMGQVLANKHPRDARLSDLVRGEEIGNFVQLDLAKVQMLFFTAILVLAYGVALGKIFLAPDDVAALITDITSSMTTVVDAIASVAPSLADLPAADLTAAATDVSGAAADVSAAATKVSAAATEVSANATGVVARMADVTSSMTDIVARMASAPSLADVAAAATDVSGAATGVGGIHGLPKLDSSMVALLGISHTGYLVNKGVRHSPGQ